MRLSVTRTYLPLVLLLGVCAGIRTALAESCQCADPPGGSVSCTDNESAHCKVVDGKCETSCTGAASGTIESVSNDSMTLNTRSGKEVFFMTKFTVRDHEDWILVGSKEKEEDKTVTVSYRRVDDRKEALKIESGPPRKRD